ncbi:MAG: hypothetical protein P8Z75_16755 [Gammaproteobacteria bacterium]
MAFNTIVVGMPRSGTSMTAAIFARAGYYVSGDDEKQLRIGDEYNPDGYWEARTADQGEHRKSSTRPDLDQIIPGCTNRLRPKRQHVLPSWIVSLTTANPD